MLLERLQIVLGTPLVLDAAGLQQRLDAKLELLLEGRVGVTDEPEQRVGQLALAPSLRGFQLVQRAGELVVVGMPPCSSAKSVRTR